MRLLLFVLVLLSVPFVYAVPSGTAQIIHTSSSPDCGAVNTTFAAGNRIYVKVNLTNTDTVELRNAKVFVIDSPASMMSVYGTYSSPAQTGIDILPNQSVIVCYGYNTFATYRPGEWRGRIYFSTYNNYYLHIPLFSFNITNPGHYEHVRLTMNASSPVTVQPGQQTLLNLTVHNLNPAAAFSGRLGTTATAPFASDGALFRNIVIPAGGTYSELVRTASFTDPQLVGMSFPVDGSTGQDHVRFYPRLSVAGSYYQFRTQQVWPDNSIYAPGEQGVVSARAMNSGNLEWNSTCCSSRFRVTSGATVIYDQLTSVTATVLPGQVGEFSSLPFTPAASLSDFVVLFEMHGPAGVMTSTWPNSISYTSAAYPDRTAGCTSASQQTEIGIVREMSCPAGGASVIFVRPAGGELLSIQATSGSLDSWWEGTRSGAQGYYLRGSANADYLLSFSISELVSLGGVSWSAGLLVLSLAALVGSLWLRDTRAR